LATRTLITSSSPFSAYSSWPPAFLLLRPGAATSRSVRILSFPLKSRLLDQSALWACRMERYPLTPLPAHQRAGLKYEQESSVFPLQCSQSKPELRQAPTSSLKLPDSVAYCCGASEFDDQPRHKKAQSRS